MSDFTYMLGVGDEVIYVVSIVLLTLFCVFIWEPYKSQTLAESTTTSGRETTRRRNRSDNIAAASDNRTDENRDSSLVENDDLSSIQNSDACIICLQNYTLKIKTNCRHEFCAQCFFTYYESNNLFRNVVCPVCRQFINKLFAIYTQEELSADNNTPLGVDRENQNSQIRIYNRRFSGEPRSLMDNIRDIPVFFRSMWIELDSLDVVS